MSAVDISDALPNGDDDSAFPEEEAAAVASDHGTAAEEESVSSAPPGVVTNQGTIPADQVFVATSQGLLTAEQLQEAGIKTTHIVIHDQTLNVEEGDEDSSELKTKQDQDPDYTQKGFKYEWDESVHCTILPVRCKNSNGELYKSKLGSGGRGKCIKSANLWYTPNEFEAFSGRASSKDWKRSIRYGGRTLQCLIEDGLLRPHATSCTCAACCDDESVTGPIRLFVPYKRRKREGESGPPSPTLKKQRPKSPTLVPSGMSKDMVVTLPSGQTLGRPIAVNSAESGETVHIVTTDAQGNFVTGDAVVMTSLANASKTSVTNALTMDVSEQKYWWQLEEMANTLVQQSQQLKTMIEQAKHQSLVAKETALQHLKLQMEKEKQEALNTARIENHMNFQRTLMEERAQKAIAEIQENSVTLVSNDKLSYAWTHPHTQGHIEGIIDGDVVEISKKE